MWLSSTLNSILMGRFRGAARLRSLAKGAAPVSLGWGKSQDGLLLSLDPDAYIDRFILRNGYYEREVLKAILDNLLPKGVFWDVGANIGLHALTVKLLRPDATVVGFEPAPFALARFVMNAQLNKLDISAFSSALGGEPGYSRMSVALRGNSGLSSLNPWPGIDYDGAIECRVDRADDLVSSGFVPSPSVIKIDVEGFEFHVLKGASNVLAGSELRAVIFESDGADLAAITDILSAAGFVCEPLRPANKAESSHASPNYLALRRST
jgi:FkbM family methyltransferase